MPKKTRGSVIVAIVHELVKGARFEREDDLVEAVKCRCAKLRIPYDGVLVYEAIDLVARTRPVLTVPKPRAVSVAPRHEEVFPLSRDEASRVLRDILLRLGRATP